MNMFIYLGVCFNAHPDFRMLVKSRGMDLESSSFLTFPKWQLLASADEVTFLISYLVWLLEGAKVG